MKNIVSASVLALAAFSMPAAAQSVLERVLGQIDNSTNLASVNGTFANIAENIGGTQLMYSTASGAIVSPEDYDFDTHGPIVDTFEVSGLGGIDGSINNTITGITAATQEAVASVDVSAIEWDMPTFDYGDMATTALGAVNTGDITLGVNSAVDEAKTSSTNAISAVMEQLGGSTDTGAIVLNVASNMTGVNGSITNVMASVNGSIGNLSTTALGAVNTGTIVSGVDAAVQGIVGTSAGQ